MANSRFKLLTGAVLGASLLISSTGAVAASNVARVHHQVNPWATLAVMSGAQPAAVLCGSAIAAATAATAAAAQPAGGCVLPVLDAPAPVMGATEPPAVIPAPPVEVAAGAGVSPLLIALAALAAGLGLYFIVRTHDNSPA